jgi:hypothetical protein
MVGRRHSRCAAGRAWRSVGHGVAALTIGLLLERMAGDEIVVECKCDIEFRNWSGEKAIVSSHAHNDGRTRKHVPRSPHGSVRSKTRARSAPNSGTTVGVVGHEAVAQGRSGARSDRSSRIMVMNALGSWNPRAALIRLWYRALRRRSQRTRLNWQRMSRLASRWIPPARIQHPWPDARFDGRTQGRSPVR